MSKSLPHKLFLGSLVSLMLMTPPASDAVEQRKQYVEEPNSKIMQLFSESWRKGTIDAAFLLNKNLDSRNIRVSVIEETAILQGSVDSPVKRSLAGEIALSVTGIDKVVNQISIVTTNQPTLAESEQPKPSQQDTLLTARINQKLLTNKYLKSAYIEVHARDGFVELSGKAPEDSVRDLAYYLAKNVVGVKSVDNKIKVRHKIL